MTALKSTKSSTALVRILALPVMVGALSACDFASKLPDAPSNIGGYGLSQKPPSVTGRGEATRLPPPPQDAFANLKAPVEDRTKQALKNTDVASLPRPQVEAPAGLELPKPFADGVKDFADFSVPPVSDTPLEEVAFAPLEFEQGAAPQALPAPQVAQSQYQVPEAPAAPAAPLDVAAVLQSVPLPAPIEVPLPQIDAPVQTQSFAQNIDVGSSAYSPTSFNAPSFDSSIQSVDQEYDVVPLETYAIAGTASQPEAISYEPAPVDDRYLSVPIGSYAIGAAPSVPVESVSTPTRVSAPLSPIAVRRARLSNGAVVNVHPVVGAPGTASATLADTVVSVIGSSVDKATADNAAVAFDLRGRAERNTDGYVSVEWQLLDSNRDVVGIFPERQNGEGWQQMSDTSLRAMGQRVADRVARNSKLRETTLFAATTAPLNTSYVSTQNSSLGSIQSGGSTVFTLQKGASLAGAPMPRLSPRASSTFVAQPRNVQSAPRSARVSAPAPRVVTQSPAPRVNPDPVQLIPQAPKVVAQAPRPVAPPPSFDTLRPSNSTQTAAAPNVVASGPRPLVFQGVHGAPGDGDQALGREVGKLLAQSGANITNSASPGALILSAQVSKTPGANSDRIEIIWRVQDTNGESVGQVTQANDVPRGLLDNAWGEDAVYAAEGARDGIIELLQGVGALDS